MISETTFKMLFIEFLIAWTEDTFLIKSAELFLV